MVGGGVVVLQPGSDWRCQLSEHLSLEADSITATPGKLLAADGAAGGAEVVGCRLERQTNALTTSDRQGLRWRQGLTDCC